MFPMLKSWKTKNEVLKCIDTLKHVLAFEHYNNNNIQ